MYNMNGLGDSSREIFFDVQEKDVFFMAWDEGYSSTPLENHKVITRDHAIPLGLVKNTYRTVKNEEVFLPLEEEIINFFDPSLLEEVKVVDHIMKQGAVCYSEYIFPSQQKDGTYKELETKSGHKTSFTLRFIILNSYDGSCSVKFYGGNIDGFCTNGMIVGAYDFAKAKHTKNFSADQFRLQLSQTLVNFNESVAKLQQYADTLIQPYQTTLVQDLFRKLTKGDADEPKRKNSLSDKLFAQFVDEQTDRGNNVFAVTSALTNYASHDSERFSLTKTGDDGTLLKRQERVRSWLNSDTFEHFVESVAA